MRIPKQEKQLKKKCLLPDEGAGVNAALTARGAKQLGSIVAAAKAQALADEVEVEESRRSFARLVISNYSLTGAVERIPTSWYVGICSTTSVRFSPK